MVTKASASDDKSIAIKEKGKNELRFIEKGVGQPIVLIHGSLSDFREWEFQN